MPYRQLKADLAQWVVQSLTRWTATYAVVQGAGIVIGGAERWTSPALRTALNIPGAPTSWGVVLVALGLLVIAATFQRHPGLVLAGACGIGLWDFSFALTLATTTYAEGSKVATTGPPAYVALAGISTMCGLAYWRSR